MRFLETIEGRNGEDLASAVLKFLLINSATMRETFVQRLRHQLPSSKAPTFRDGIICQNEVAVSNDDGIGRIDLLIKEAAGMVFGLENKFWASFTDNQPKKYWDHLKEKEQANKDESLCRIVVLIPRIRRPEVGDHLKKQGIEKKCCTILWEDLQEDLSKLAQPEKGERRDVATAASFLHEYVTRQLDASSINIKKDHLLGEEVQLPNDFHSDFLYQLKTCLPNPERIRSTKESSAKDRWIGFNFNVVPSTESKEYATQWFGFVRANDNPSVVMGIHTGLPQYNVESSLTWARDGSRYWNKAFIEVDYDESIKSTLEWRDKLAKILDPLAEVVRNKPMSAK